MAEYELGTKVRHNASPSHGAGRIVAIDQGDSERGIFYQVWWAESRPIWYPESELTAEAEEEVKRFK